MTEMLEGVDDAWPVEPVSLSCAGGLADREVEQPSETVIKTIETRAHCHSKLLVGSFISCLAHVRSNVGGTT